MKVASLASAVALAAGLFAQSLPPPPATGLIVGQVVDATTGKPVPDSIVTLSQVGRTSGPPGRATTRSLITDATGRFFFADLAAGSFSVSVKRPGYVDGGHGRTGPRVPTTPVELGAGEIRDDVRIPMWKFGSISGAVSDEAGDPVVGVTVRILRRRFVLGQRRATPEPGATAVTDDRGAYRIPSLPPGDYLVSVPSVQTTIPAALLDEYFRASGDRQQELSTAIFSVTSSISTPGSASNQTIGDMVLRVQGKSVTPPEPDDNGRLSVYPTAFHPETTLAAQAAVVTLAAGEERSGINVHVRLAAAFRVAGTIRSPAGRVGNTAVQLLAAAPGELDDDSADFAVASAISDANGAFTMLGVPAGQYVLRVLKVPPLARADAPRPAPGAPPPRPPLPKEPTLWAIDPVTVADTDVTDLTVTLRAGARVSGRVEFDGASPKPRLSTIELDLFAVSGQRTGIVPPGQVDDDGRFATYGMAPGRYFLLAPPPAPWSLKSAMFEGRDISATPIEVKGADIAGVVVTYTDHPIRVSGTVRTPQGAADPAAFVILFSTDVATWKEMSPYPRRLGDNRATTSGVYTIAGVAPGDYFLVAIPAALVDGYVDPAFMETLSHLATRVTLGEGEQKTLDLMTAAVKR